MSTQQSEKEFFDHTYDTNARKSVGQVYSLIGNRNKAYEDLIYSNVEGKRVLEYGCGEGSHSLEIAQRGGLVTGIDISEVGIRKASEAAESAGVSGADYQVMDAMNMDFPDNTFDVVIGEGILHHLDLDKSYSEISRVLKPGGKAIFQEPLGHNPAMALFRAMTPKLRTDDEHPLLHKDLKLAGKYFGNTEFKYFHLTSFGALLFLKFPFFYGMVNFLDKVDAGLFKVVPPLGLLSWYCIMVMSKGQSD
ncbi:MAG: class I SAM-dependent methyltransferase [bacterium]|nr:class I SAM-dependent methyltransferase [bacterium]